MNALGPPWHPAHAGMQGSQPRSATLGGISMHTTEVTVVRLYLSEGEA